MIWINFWFIILLILVVIFIYKVIRVKGYELLYGYMVRVKGYELYGYIIYFD